MTENVCGGCEECRRGEARKSAEEERDTNTLGGSFALVGTRELAAGRGRQRQPREGAAVLGHSEAFLSCFSASECASPDSMHLTHTPRRPVLNRLSLATQGSRRIRRTRRPATGAAHWFCASLEGGAAVLPQCHYAIAQRWGQGARRGRSDDQSFCRRDSGCSFADEIAPRAAPTSALDSSTAARTMGHALVIGQLCGAVVSCFGAVTIV